MPDNSYQPIRLRANEHKRLTAGHSWIFSNEIDTKVTPLKPMTPGQLVTVERSSGQPLAVGYVNPHSLISVRLLSRNPKQVINANFLKRRLSQALRLRENIFPEPYYRWVFGEADGLPGLILDRYGDYCVGQLNTAGMEALRTELEQCLAQVASLKGVLWRNDSAVRELEGLPREIVAGVGVIPPRLSVLEAGSEFQIDPRCGQKTGWFYDQRTNRDAALPWFADARVLDLYCYAGAWAIRAAAAGAEAVVAIDSSATAIEWVRENSVRNGVDQCVEARQSDVEAYLAKAREEREHFDVVVLDPPALVKRARDKPQGLAAYRRLNQAALTVIRYGGILISCSCSAHVSLNDLQLSVLRAARHVDREVQILRVLQQGPDHPVHPAIPETRYLKGLVLRVLPSF